MAMNAIDRSGDSSPPAEPAEGEPDSRPRVQAPRRVRVETLLAGTREIIIEHRDDEYRLRLTSKGKLILTK